MSNRALIAFVLVLIGLAAIDHFAFDSTGLVFLARKLADLVEYLAFWR